jgi:hypothetical protein
VHIANVMAVNFAAGGNVHEGGDGPWVSPSEANAFFQGLAALGDTNYSGAINAVMNAWDGYPPGPADKTLVYFISDGQPTQALDTEQASTWRDFLEDNHVDASYAIGISTSVEDIDLAPIAWSSDEANFPPVILESATGLSDTLQGTINQTHNIFDEGATYGGDGGHIESITVDGVTYTWDGQSVTASQPGSWSATGAALTVTTALGGILTFHFSNGDGPDAGDWTYKPPEAVDHSANEVFRYTLVDSDGDRASADITVHVYDQNGPQPADDVVVTNATGSLDIPGWVLLRNDNDPDGFLSVTSADNSGSTIQVEHDGSTTSVDLNGLSDNSDTFTYTVSDTRMTADATVTVTQTANLDQSQACGDRIIVAASAATMAGGSGNDVLIGSAGADTMTGNGGADAFAFKPCNGADVVTDFSGHGGQGDVIALDGFSFANFADLKQNASITDIGQDGEHATLIDFGGGNTITLVDVDPTHLTAADFIFHAASSNIV